MNSISQETVDAFKALQPFADRFCFGIAWQEMIESGFKKSKQAEDTIINVIRYVVYEDGGRSYIDYADFVSDENRLSCAMCAARYINDHEPSAVEIARYAASDGLLTNESTDNLLDRIARERFAADGGELSY